MENKILEAITSPLDMEGIKVSSVSIGEEDSEKTLFIVLDNVSTTEECVKATNIINPIIDSLNLELEDYVLDVCSKGEENE